MSTIKGRFHVQDSCDFGENADILGHAVFLVDTFIGDRTLIRGNCVSITRSKIGKDCILWHHLNIYDSVIGDKTKVASFIEIGGSDIGNNCLIESMVFIPPGVKIGNNCFIGPQAAFANDKYPRSDGIWEKGNVTVEDNVKVGLASRILPIVRIGKNSLIAAGAVITKNVPESSIAIGHPAHILNMPNILTKIFRQQLLEGTFTKEAIVKEMQ